MTLPNGAPCCPWCAATGADPCRTTDGRQRVHHKARARMERAGRRIVTPPAWRARHVESGATVACRDQEEAEVHVRESASGPWVAEPSTPPRYTPWRGIRCRHEECAEFGICLVGPPTPDLDADSAAHREAADDA